MHGLLGSINFTNDILINNEVLDCFEKIVAVQEIIPDDEIEIVKSLINDKNNTTNYIEKDYKTAKLSHYTTGLKSKYSSQIAEKSVTKNEQKSVTKNEKKPAQHEK